MSIAEDKLTLQNLRIGSEDNMDAENQTFQNKSKTLNSIELNSSSTLSHRSLPISSWPWCKYQECFPVNAPCTHWMSLVLGISQNYRIYHLAQVEQFSLLHANFQLPKPDQKKKICKHYGTPNKTPTTRKQVSVHAASVFSSQTSYLRFFIGSRQSNCIYLCFSSVLHTWCIIFSCNTKLLQVSWLIKSILALFFISWSPWPKQPHKSN